MKNKYKLLIVKFPEGEETKIEFDTDIDNRIWIELPDKTWYQTSLYEIIELLNERRAIDIAIFYENSVKSL
jgi:hypothetical protein